MFVPVAPKSGASRQAGRGASRGAPQIGRPKQTHNDTPETRPKRLVAGSNPAATSRHRSEAAVAAAAATTRRIIQSSRQIPAVPLRGASQLKRLVSLAQTSGSCSTLLYNKQQPLVSSRPPAGQIRIKLLEANFLCVFVAVVGPKTGRKDTKRG